MENSIIIALIIFAGHAMTWDGQIFAFVRKLIDEKKVIAKPIYSCPICMTPYYGTILWFLFFRISYVVDAGEVVKIIGSVSDWFLCIAPATGLSVVSVIFIHINDYVKSRTRKEECC